MLARLLCGFLNACLQATVWGTSRLAACRCLARRWRTRQRDDATGGVAGGWPPAEGVAEDQTEGDVDAPQARTYRPECGAVARGRLPPS
jgi:hypothetical protein